MPQLFYFTLVCRHQYWRKLAINLFGLLSLSLAFNCQAEPNLVQGQWYQVPMQWRYQAQTDFSAYKFTPIKELPVTGGHFLFESRFTIPNTPNDDDDDYVLDFNNSTTISKFRHYIFKQDGSLLASFEGGITSHSLNPFFLRLGRDFSLGPGSYRLVTELYSPYFIAPPQLYLDRLIHYEQSIKISNAIALICLGILLGLGIYYTALSIARKNAAEAMYALFLFGNLIFNSAALLVFSDLFGPHNFYLTSAPILFSNIAYVFFVMNLLEINLKPDSWLFKAGMTLITVMICFLPACIAQPSWTLELARYGVAGFLSYGLTAGIITSLKGNRSARVYLVAIICFFVLGGMTITTQQIFGTYTFHIEHLGLVSVSAEAILLALVLSYQFAVLRREKERTMAKLETSEKRALHDALTGLPNRYALEDALAKLGANSCLTFLDLDNLKFYNDHFGHDYGDNLLRNFSHDLQKRLGLQATLHRLGGDEFAITCPSGNQIFIESMLEQSVTHLRLHGFEFAGFSKGTVHCHETGGTTSTLMHLADSRMYENKRKRKKGGPQKDILVGI
jgi:diguanylate cyclase